MLNIKSQKTTWLFIFGYIVFIYVTLPFGRCIVKFLYSNIGRCNLTIIINVLFISIFFYFFYFIRKKDFILILVSVSLMLFIGLIIFSLKLPEERVHFLEYGILGFLVCKALKVNSLKDFLLCLILVFVVGLIDEIIQYFLPNRVGDIRDVFMNFCGGFIGLWFGKMLY